MAQAIGQECTLSVGGTVVAARLTAANPVFTFAVQARLSSGPQVGGVDQSLLGYMPSSSARSGFQITFQIPYSGAATFLTQCLTPAGSNIIIGFDAAGCVGVTGCIAEQLEVSGTEGQEIQGRATFQSIAVPVPNTGLPAKTALQFFSFYDVDHVTLPAGTHTDVTAFSFRVQRVLAAYRGNSPTGIPKYLRIARTECLLDATYLKHDDTEGVTQVSGPPITLADSSIALIEKPLYGTGAATLTLTCKDSFADPYPTATGDFETFINEQLSVRASQGAYTIT